MNEDNKAGKNLRFGLWPCTIMLLNDKMTYTFILKNVSLKNNNLLLKYTVQNSSTCSSK